MRRSVGLTIALVAALAPVSAQTPAPPALTAGPRFTNDAGGLSLDDAIARALAKEPSLAAGRFQIEAARSERRQASLRPNPTVGFEWRDEPRGTDSLTSLMFEWPMDLFRKPGREAVADRLVTAASAALADRERLLAADVRTRYGEALGEIRRLQVVESVVGSLERQLRNVQARVAEGAAPPLEADIVQVDLDRLEADRRVQTGRAERALLAVGRRVGADVSGPIVLADTLEAVVAREVRVLPVEMDRARLSAGIRADIEEAAARLGVADAEVGRAQQEGRPDLTAFGTYMRMDAGFPQSGLDAGGAPARIRGTFHYVSAGFRLMLPVRQQNQGAAAAAAARRASAEADLEAARRDAAFEQAAAAIEAQRAREAVEIYGTGARARAAKNLGVVLESYALGRVSLNEVLVEQRRYLEVELGYTEALLAVFDAHTALTVSAGGVR